MGSPALLFNEIALKGILDLFDAPIYITDGAAKEVLFYNEAAKKEFGEGRLATLEFLSGATFGEKEESVEIKSKGYWVRVSQIELADKRVLRVFVFCDKTNSICGSRGDEDLKSLNETLERLVAEKSSKIVEQERMLFQQARMSAMGEMIAAIAHQWRQPLNALGIMIQGAKMEHEHVGISDEYMETFKKNAMEQINFMSKTIDSFRDFFKINKEKEGFDVTSSILDVVRLLRPQFASSGIYIIVNAEKKLTVNGYPNEFMQVILNILNNARDALLEKKPQTPEININIEQQGEYCVLSIADNGGGVDKRIIEKIFDPYFTTKGPDKGTGIGLYMAKKIIESNMDGYLGVRNSGTGCVFTIKIPLKSASRKK